MKIFIQFTLVLILTISCSKKSEFTFAGGFPGGTYDTLAKSLTELPHLTIKVIDSKGSLDNVYSLLDKKAELSLSQLDMFYSAKISEPKIEKNISILFPILNDEVHLIVKKSIHHLNDLKGKKIAIGHPESGIKATSLSIIQMTGLNFTELELLELSPEQAIPLLLKDELDAVIVVSGLPVKILTDLSTNVNEKIKLFNFENATFDQIKSNNRVYQKSIIPKNTYSWQQEEINTLEVQTVLLVRKDLDESSIKLFLKTLFANQEFLSKKHPEWKGLDKRTLKLQLKKTPELFHPLVKEMIQ